MRPDEYERGVAELQRLTVATSTKLDGLQARIDAIRGRLGNNDKTQHGANVRANGTPGNIASQAEVASK